jgi:transcriptional regulator with XRE-family HTH domain
VKSDAKLKEAFGKVLLELRTEKGISQQELADNCELERAHISRIERALLQPSLTTIFRLSEYFQVTPSELLHKVQLNYKKKK